MKQQQFETERFAGIVEHRCAYLLAKGISITSFIFNISRSKSFFRND